MIDEVEQSRRRRFKILKFLQQQSYIPKITTVDDLTQHLKCDPSIALNEAKILEDMSYVDRTLRNGHPTWMIKAKAKNIMESNPKNLDHFFALEKESKKPKSEYPSKNLKNYWNEHKPMIMLSIAITIGGGLLVGGFFYYLSLPDEELPPPKPEIHVTDLNAKDGRIEGNKFTYSYEPRTLTPNGTKNETFTLKVSNIGNAEAHDFWIDLQPYPDGLWFDYKSSMVIDAGNSKSCQQKKSYCTIELIPKEYSSYGLQYDVSFDHKLIQEIADESPKLFFTYDYDEGEEQKIEIYLKFD